MRLQLLAAAAAAIAAGCEGCEANSPPAAVLPRHLPADTFADYPHDDGGLPVLSSAEGDGFAIDLVYDESLDDPIAHWGECLDRVTSCFATNHGKLGGCVDKIEICDAGQGFGCCPQTCIDAYKHERESKSERDAVLASFLAGDCIDGLKEQRAILDEPDVTP